MNGRITAAWRQSAGGQESQVALLTYSPQADQLFTPADFLSFLSRKLTGLSSINYCEAV